MTRIGLTYSHALYAISDGVHVKIGRVTYHRGGWKSGAIIAVDARAAALQVGNPRRLTVGGIYDLSGCVTREAQLAERQMHSLAASVTARAQGEWFVANRELIRALRDFGFVISSRRAAH